MIGIVFAFSAGRIASYTLAGAVAGFIGGRFTRVLEQNNGHFVLQVIAGIILVILGLHIAGWMPRLKLIEKTGTRLWQYLQPLGKHFLPVTNIARALLTGVIWGWLPCALVYSVLLLAVTSDSWQQGAVYLFVFGLGTLPVMLTAGMISGLVRQHSQNIPLRCIAGLLIVIVGIITPLFHIGYDSRHSHGANHTATEKLLQRLHQGFQS